MKKVIMLASILLVSLNLTGCGSSSSSSNDTAKTESSAVKSSKEEKTITYDGYEKLAVSSEKNYNTNFSDTSWSPATIKVNKVTIYKLVKPYKIDSSSEGKYEAQGMIKIDYDITANQDCSLYPLQGTYSFNNGEQHEDVESSNNWDGDFNKGSNKKGSVMIPVKQLNNVDNIKTIRVKFDGSYETNNSDDDNSFHTYDFTLNLQ